MASANRPAENNRLLRSLPPRDYRALAALLEPVALELKQVIHEIDRPLEHLYFPRTGVISLLTIMKNGDAVEAATIGNDGMVGVGVVLEAVHEHLRAICQVPGAAARIKAPAFRRLMARRPALRRLMHRYSQGLMIQFTQGVACNRLHTVEQRAARWLLMTHDRVEADTFPLTHEFLGQMLGVRRASVTVVAGMLQRAGLIEYTRGSIQVLNRKGLEKQACECYAVIRRETERLTNGG